MRTVDTKTAFAIRLRKERLARGLSQKELGDLTGTAKQGVCAYETGKRAPRIDTARKIAECLGVSMDYLCGMSMRRTGEKEVDCERIASCE